MLGCHCSPVPRRPSHYCWLRVRRVVGSSPLFDSAGGTTQAMRRGAVGRNGDRSSVTIAVFAPSALLPGAATLPCHPLSQPFAQRAPTPSSTLRRRFGFARPPFAGRAFCPSLPPAFLLVAVRDLTATWAMGLGWFFSSFHVYSRVVWKVVVQPNCLCPTSLAPFTPAFTHIVHTFAKRGAVGGVAHYLDSYRVFSSPSHSAFSLVVAACLGGSVSGSAYGSSSYAV
jgi:hypothetical protein